MPEQIRPPEPLDAHHVIIDFNSGETPLDDWLKNDAIRSEGATARTYVVCQGTRVIGYYCLATGSVMHERVNAKLRRNTPNPIPAIVIGRLAVDERFQGQGIGRGLLKDAFSRIVELSRIAGVRLVVVHAIDDDAARFYLKYGFVEFPKGERTLHLAAYTLYDAIT